MAEEAESSGDKPTTSVDPPPEKSEAPTTFTDDSGPHTVIVRGTITVPADEAAEMRRRFVHRMRHVPGVRIDAVDLIEPSHSLDMQKRPLYSRIALAPAMEFSDLSCTPLFGRSPRGWYRFAMWLGIIACVLRVGAVIPDLRSSTRLAFTVASTVMLIVGALGFVPSLQPAVLLRNVLLTFDFWYVFLQVCAIVLLEHAAAAEIVDNAGVNAALHFLLFVAILISFVFVDAIAMPKPAKAGRYMLFAVVCIVEVGTWSFANIERFEPIDLVIFSTTWGALAQSLYATVAAFMLRNTLNTLSNNDAIMRPLAGGTVARLPEPEGVAEETPPAGEEVPPSEQEASAREPGTTDGGAEHAEPTETDGNAHEESQEQTVGERVIVEVQTAATTVADVAGGFASKLGFGAGSKKGDDTTSDAPRDS